MNRSNYLDFEPWLRHFADAPLLLLLNSNPEPGTYPEAYCTFDWMLAVSYGEAWQPTTACFDALEQLLSQAPDYYFGYLTYDLKNELEQLRSQNTDGMAFPQMAFFRPQLLVRASDGKIELLRNELGFPYPKAFEDEKGDEKRDEKGAELPKLEFKRHLSDEAYLKTVAQIREDILAGTIYELNLCMEWSCHHIGLDSLATYLQLNRKTRAPFSAYLKSGIRSLMSASPERFLRKHKQQLLSQPIKGTMARSLDPELDHNLKQQLANNPKERAENVMIVDLVRNDLSRSSLAGSVQVPELMQVYSFKTVHQMISTVSATLQAEVTAVQALKNAFPMGSMTGAPKIKAMELIEAYENAKRGLYSGAVGYFTPEGDFDFNVVIRSLQYRADTGYLSLMTGSAITYDSVPAQELEECKLKAKALLEIFG
ncbi:MAG: anthranilate synthase component I family protein [Bacteroidia bacterium]